jgi:hypothetical protein
MPNNSVITENAELRKTQENKTRQAGNNRATYMLSPRQKHGC